MQHHSLFDDKSGIYERARPTYPDAIYQYLAEICDVNATVWDCACGNGQAAIGLARKFDCVYATDVSVQQIVNAKQQDGIHFSQSTAESTVFEDDYFDLVCVAQALHWFDYELFWPELKRVMKPGSIFSAWGYNWAKINPVIDALLQETILDQVKPYWAQQNQLLWNHYRDLEIPFEPLHTPTFEMKLSMNLHQLFDFIHTWSATRRCMAERGNLFFESAFKKMEDCWGNPSHGKALHFDFFFYAGVNR